MDLRLLVRRAGNRARLSSNPLARRLFDLVRTTYRLVGRWFPFLHLGWMSSLRGVTWDDGDLVLRGWAFVRGADFGETPDFRVSLHRWFGLSRVAASAVRPVDDPDVLGASRSAEHDYRNMSFEARFAREALDALASKGRGSWQVRVRVSGNRRRSWGPLRRMYAFGSPVLMALRPIGERHLVGPTFDERRGTRVVVRPAGAVVRAATVSGRALTVRVDPAADVTDAVLTGVGQEEVPFTVERTGDGVELRAHVPPGVPVTDELTGERHPPTWTAVAGSGQARRPLTVLDDTVRHRPDAASSLYLRAGIDRGLTVVDVPHFVELDRIDASDDQLRLSGTVVGDPATFSLVLASAHLDVPVTVGSVVDGRFEATAPLRVSVWGGPELPLPRGVYVLEGRVGTDPFSTFVTPELVGRLPVVDSRPHLRMRFELARRDGLRMRITRPRLPNEYGAYNQTKLLERYAQDDLPPLDAVYFESFFGRNATCNPRAMDREIARRRPDLPRYWAVDDYSVQVPPGGIPLVIGSEDWWRVRESARWIVTNEWFRTRYVKKPYQTVLQTWHGSMYKKIGLDRTKKGKAHLARVRLERSSWDLFLSQNGDTTPIIRRAYDFTGGVVESGYPRNDELHDPDPERIQAVRDALGINPGDTVVMYAPTWRELNQEDVELLNVVDVSERLGPGFTFLQRGHVRTLDLSQVVRHDNVIDVSTYPQINDLYLAADVLITDYSSMMFDFSVTRRPMIFYTPDIEEYTDPRVRGVYFDLEEVAAGPVVKTPEEVVNLLATLDTWVPTYADRYAAWTERFNHADDGHASERAVDALFAFDPHQRSSVPQRNVPLPAGAGEDA